MTEQRRRAERVVMTRVEYVRLADALRAITEPYDTWDEAMRHLSEKVGRNMDRRIVKRAADELGIPHHTIAEMESEPPMVRIWHRLQQIEARLSRCEADLSREPDRPVRPENGQTRLG